MARLTFPDEGSRLVYRLAGSTLASAAGGTAVVYSDEAGTTPADIQTPAGAAIADSTLTVDSSSLLPLWLGPDETDTVYVRVNGGPATAVYARADDRIDRATATADATAAAFRSPPAAAGGVNVLMGWPGNAIADDTHGGIILGDGTLNRENVVGNGVVGNVNTASSNVPPGGAAALRGTSANHCIVGGYDNVAAGLKSVILADHSYIAGPATHGIIGGGSGHKIDDGDQVTIAGGRNNSASGDYATIAGGDTNTATGNYSFTAGQNNAVTAAGAASLGSANAVAGASAVGIGQAHVVTANYSAAFGRYGNTRTVGQAAFSAGRFSVNGDAQSSVVTMSKETTVGTQQIIGPDNSSVSHKLLEDQSVAFSYLLVGRDTSNGDSKAWRVEGLAKRETGVATPTLVAAVSKTVIAASSGASTWDTFVTPAADNTLGIRVLGEAGKTIRWVATVTLAEVIG